MSKPVLYTFAASVWAAGEGFVTLNTVGQVIFTNIVFVLKSPNLQCKMIPSSCDPRFSTIFVALN